MHRETPAPHAAGATCAPQPTLAARSARTRGWPASPWWLLAAIAALAWAAALPVQAATAREDFALAFEHLKAQRFEPAAAQFEKGLKAEPKNAQAWFYLAEAQLGLQQPKKAKVAYEKSLAVDGKSPVAAQARERLKQLAAAAAPAPAAGPASASATAAKATAAEPAPALMYLECDINGNEVTAYRNWTSFIRLEELEPGDWRMTLSTTRLPRDENDGDLYPGKTGGRTLGPPVVSSRKIRHCSSDANGEQCEEVDRATGAVLVVKTDKKGVGAPGGQGICTRPSRVPPPKPKVVAAAASAASAAAPTGPGAAFKDCPVCPEMVTIPAGQFTMGSPNSEVGRDSDEGPQHQVTIAKPFAVGKFEVTFDEWEACVAERACRPAEDSGFGKGRRPVININFQNVELYLDWLSEKTGKKYRLLSEAEWEYAARAGTDTSRFWGNVQDKACQYANVRDLQRGSGEGYFDCDDGQKYTAPVGTYKPNAFGLYDMLGNVWEWTADCYKDDYQGAPTDGSASTAGDCGRRVIRGGSWDNFPQNVRSAERYGITLSSRDSVLGFRVARTLP